MRNSLKFINSVKRNKITFFIACLIFLLELGLLIGLLTSPDNKQIGTLIKILPIFILAFGLNTLKDFLNSRDIVKEQQAAENSINFIEVKGLFYLAFYKESPKRCFTSAKEIREKLTDNLDGLRNTDFYKHVNEIREACSKLMRALEKNNISDVEFEMNLNDDEREIFYRLLVNFRNDSRKAIFSICKEYGITVQGSLSTLNE
jgi:hypothetical protein